MALVIRLIWISRNDVISVTRYLIPDIGNISFAQGLRYVEKNPHTRPTMQLALYEGESRNDSYESRSGAERHFITPLHRGVSPVWVRGLAAAWSRDTERAGQSAELQISGEAPKTSS